MTPGEQKKTTWFPKRTWKGKPYWNVHQHLGDTYWYQYGNFQWHSMTSIYTRSKYVHDIMYIYTYRHIVYHLVWNMRVVLVSCDTLETRPAGTAPLSPVHMTLQRTTSHLYRLYGLCQEWLLTAHSEIFEKKLARQWSYHTTMLPL